MLPAPVAADPSLASTPDASGLSARCLGLPPVAGVRTVVLVLGSFPGAASLQARQYYAHPQNHFWKILQALWPQHPLPPAGPDSYADRCAWLLDRGLGLWDVYQSCEREGSLDTSIRNARLNDFAALRSVCPRLAALAHNGAESFRHAPAALAALGAAGPPTLLPHDVGTSGARAIEAVRLPSTSPANASWSFERKLTAWADVMARHGLL
ncbi:G/U mismatch-specific uracil-DNA glycosylase [Acidovorax sp. 99]|uniref:DNA-deoxyinosine glycosylase n=1 Tax=Acidovorax TaxID=12916 RepID=UPI000D5E1D67|nr:DNA-deoxyinosine glycosylase [Acidovorax sp. 99]PVY92298.1 G/U mismatch-specific uracil-DNA glycosylase [Acidovorax sp. 99]